METIKWFFENIPFQVLLLILGAIFIALGLGVEYRWFAISGKNNRNKSLIIGIFFVLIGILLVLLPPDIITAGTVSTSTPHLLIRPYLPLTS
jgi:hypothetical protein